MSYLFNRRRLVLACAMALSTLLGGRPGPMIYAQSGPTSIHEDFTQPDGQPGLDPDLRYEFVRCFFDEGSGCGITALSSPHVAPSPPHVLYLYGPTVVRIRPLLDQAAAQEIRFQVFPSASGPPSEQGVTIGAVGATGTMTTTIALLPNQWQEVVLDSTSPSSGGGPIGPIRELRVALGNRSTFLEVDEVVFSDVRTAQPGICLPLVTALSRISMPSK